MVASSIPTIRRPGTLIAAARAHWQAAHPYQRFLYAAGLLLIASAIFHTGVLLVTGGTLAGDTSWRKPILFAEAFGLTALTLGWVMTYLPRRPVLGWTIALMLGLANLGEVAWVTLQQWRGVPSHFNDSTALDGALFAAAGGLIVVASIAIVALTVWAFRGLLAPPALNLAIRSGLLLLIAGLFLGLSMILNNGHQFGVAGDMKVPHALALHAIQALPVLALLFHLTPWEERSRTRLILLASAAYALAVLVAAALSLRGQALVPTLA
jgi:hypothetical protein